MPDFEYRASSATGALERGVLSATNKQAAIRQLRNRGLTPVQVVFSAGGAAGGADGAADGGGSAGGVGRDMVLVLTSELAVLLRAGLPIDRALKVQEEMSQKPEYAAMVRGLLDSVKSGKSLSSALESYQSLFGKFYLNMVRAGEASGRLGDVLQRLSETLQVEQERRRAVVSALIYPAILAAVAVLSVGVMLGFVVPQFESLFSDMGEALPAMTAAVLAIGNFVKAYFLPLFILIGIAAYFARNWLTTPEGSLWRDQRIIATPLIGDVARKYAMAQFSRTLGTLVSNGVKIVTAITIASDTVENRILRGAMEELPAQVKSGKPLSDIMSRNEQFTPMMVQMVRVGEESGRLGEMLLELARIYDTEVESAIKRVLALIEPALILIMGLVIAILIVSILMGILAVNDLAL